MFTEEDRLQGLGTSLSSEDKSLECLERGLFCKGESNLLFDLLIVCPLITRTRLSLHSPLPPVLAAATQGRTSTINNTNEMTSWGRSTIMGDSKFSEMVHLS